MSVDCKQKIWIKAKKELLESGRTPVKDQQVVTVPCFQETDDWVTFLDRLELYFQENSIKSDRQVPILLTSISESVFNTLKKLCRPDVPTAKSFKQLTCILSKHFSEKSVWKERIKFFKLKQAGEDVDEWFDKVRNAALSCDFGPSFDEHVRNKFVSGMKAGPILERLCEEEKDKSSADLLHIALTKNSLLNDNSRTLVANKPLNKVISPMVRRSPRRLNGFTSTHATFPQLFQPYNKWRNQDDRDERRGTKRPHGGDDDNDDSPAPTCLCGLTARKLIVRREGPNQGREFFVCPKDENKCSSYTWADEVAVQIQCFCQLTARKMTVRKEGPNQGRQFYGCPKNHGDGSRCQFFVWADEADSGNYSGSSSGGGNRRGSGGNFRPSSTSSRGGRGGRSGPSPAKKSKPPSKPSSNFRATGNKEPAKVRKCGVCGQPGHNRKNCPQNGG